MKTSAFIRILVALVTFTGPVQDASATRYIVGLSPNYSRADGQTVFKSLLLFVLEGAAPGDELLVYDALNQAPVTRFNLPKPGVFGSNPRARAQQLKAEIAQLQQFLNTERPHAVEMANALHVPLFLDLAGTQLRRPGEPVRVILIGSPLYRDKDDPGFTLEEGFPSDGHLLVSQRESPLGTANKPKALEGVTVHYAFLRPCFVNDYHQERVRRFWGLFCQTQRGVLSSFAPDVALVFQRAKDYTQEPCVEAALDANDTKVELRHVTPRRIPVWFGPTNVLQQVTAPAVSTTIASEVPPATTEPAQPSALPVQPTSFPVESAPGKVGIGIMWSAPVDCDLYIKPSFTTRELYYRSTRSSEGRYYQDYRSANAGADYEFVELSESADLRTVSAWVNYYKGRTAGVRGLVVVHYQDRTYHGEFSLVASMGNGGQESQSRESSRYWTRLDLLKIVGLDSSAVGRASEP